MAPNCAHDQQGFLQNFQINVISLEERIREKMYVGLRELKSY